MEEKLHALLLNLEQPCAVGHRVPVTFRRKGTCQLTGDSGLPSCCHFGGYRFFFSRCSKIKVQTVSEDLKGGGSFEHLTFQILEVIFLALSRHGV
jgi:hypothetical protein